MMSITRAGLSIPVSTKRKTHAIHAPPDSNRLASHIACVLIPPHSGHSRTSQVMLLTSRKTRRWVIPKGWPIKERKPAEVASQEAYEEAGLIGQIVGKRPLGSFHYGKLIGKKVVRCQVRVFLFQVERQLDDWPEKSERETQWFEASEAARLVDEGGPRSCSVRSERLPIC